MDAPKIIQPCKLTDDESEFLEDLTGNEYDRALNCVDGLEIFNTKICLVHEAGIDELVVDGQKLNLHDADRGIAPDISGHDFVLSGERGDDWFEKKIEWSQKVADIFARCDRGLRMSGTDIELIERNEPDEIKEKRLKNFIEYYQRLTPGQAFKIRVVDFRQDDEHLGSATSHSLLSGQIAISPDGLEFEHTFFHEAAHLMTTWLSNLDIEADNWMQTAGNVYVGDAWNDLPADADSAIKLAVQDGFISWYSRKDMHEDIAELIAFINITPGYVGWMANDSQKLWEKIDFLYYHELITEEQMIDVLKRDYSYIEREWKDIAGNVQIGKDTVSKLSYEELLKMSFLSRAAVTDPRKDILYFLGAINDDPCWLRGVVKDNPKIAAKLEFLYANRMITGKQYDFLTSEKLPEMPDLPYCAQPICEYARGSFWGSVECYFKLALDNVKFINALMMPI